MEKFAYFIFTHFCIVLRESIAFDAAPAVAFAPPAFPQDVEFESAPTAQTINRIRKNFPESWIWANLRSVQKE
jgi:hypothetical protein